MIDPAQPLTLYQWRNRIRSKRVSLCKWISWRVLHPIQLWALRDPHLIQSHPYMQTSLYVKDGVATMSKQQRDAHRNRTSISDIDFANVWHIQRKEKLIAKITFLKTSGQKSMHSFSPRQVQNQCALVPMWSHEDIKQSFRANVNQQTRLLVLDRYIDETKKEFSEDLLV